MAGIGDGFRDVFYAGIGALAITGEKAKEVVDQLVAKGEITVDQGKQINSELMHKAEEAASTVRFDVLEARMRTMTPEQRTEFAAKAAEFAQAANAADAVAAAQEPGDGEPVDVEASEGSEGSEGSAKADDQA